MAFNVNQQNILTAFIVAGMVLLFLKVGLNITKVYEQRPTQKPVVRSLAPKRVLVTGAAGFIGFHLSRVLAQNKNNFIVGLDDYNDYYDVRLKIDRAYELHKLGIEVHNEDLCNVDFLEELFLKYDFTHVAHMAAQAGVRYSLENPLAYIHSNVECQMALLNVLRDFPKVKLVYASSSSVYGKESSIPFRLSAFTDRPGNMYAATKKTDELLGYYHCHAYNLSAVGLRFFTVYGPWGRPDMAVYKFGEAIVEGKKVPMFHTTDENPLGRDFTYVDDIVDGIMASLDYNPTECGERFNLGFGHPVSVPGLIKLMEEELGIPAEVEKLPLPPTEILKTWADISTSTALLEFNPKTDLKTGVSHFAKWYLDYRKLRKEQEKLNKPTDSEIWFSQKFNDTIARGQRYKDKAAEREKWRVMKRYEYEVERDPSVHDEEIVLPNIKDKKFILHKGVTFEGGDILAHYDTNGVVEKWTRMCKHNSYCIGFTTKGMQKYIAWPKSQFKQLSQSSETDGIYLADVNMCDLKLHKCHEHAECKNLGKGTYNCACNEGFIGDGMMCVPTLDVISWNTIKMDNFVEMHSIYNISEWKMETKIYFFKGVSAPGGDFLHAPKLAGNINKLIKQCSSIPICVGVSTDGYLKKKIVPRDKWLYDSKKTNEGLIVFDVNYCLLNDEGCPEHSECVHLGPGDWQCQCEESYVSKNGQCIKFPPIHSSLLPKPDTIPEGPANNVKAQLLNNRGVHTIKQ